MPLKDLVMSAAERAKRRRDRELVEAHATKLYDELNSQPDKVIRVSKAECLRRARFALRSRGLVSWQ